MLAIVLMFPASPLSMAENEEEIPEWGFYVYMAGDNSLYEEVDDDLNEMKMVGSNNDLEIVVLTDQVPQDDSHAYRVIQHGLEETPLQEINASWSNELDMGKGETLRDFMIWATTEYPAEKKILVIWNHGSGWEKVAEDRESHLTVPEIRESIEQYREETGDSKLTMIGFDACLMGMFEIAYELKDQAEMVHGSEAYEPLEGWTYNHLLYKLDKNLTNEELAQNVVYDYVESYRNGSVYTSYSVTAAVIDTTKLESLWNDLENFSSELNSILPIYRDEISNSRDNTQRYDQNPNYRDLYDLTINIENQIPMSDSKKYSEKLQNSINSAIMAEDHWQKPEKLPVDRAHGLTIYFPNEGIKTGYSDLRISQNSWYEFIENFEMGISSKANFNNLYTSSVDTGTGHNDSVLINGNYNGNASEIKIRLVNSDGKVMNTYDGQVNNGIISNIFLQPTKSGNYSLEIGLYGDSGFLEDHYINENLFINLQLPDLVANSPRIMIEDEKGDSYQVENIQNGDVFWIEGDIQNIGTVASKNITVLVNDNGVEKQFHFAKIEPNQIETWSISSNASSLGEYNLEVELWSEDQFEIDPENNYTSFSFMIFDKIGHEYQVNTENKNILEIETNEKENMSSHG
uniref:Peptidase C11 clostripain n=1 Tax=uncultured marine group II/III euryarchaeote AD1000_41_D11 TaxID=1457766 RepID=A0A075FRR3_9EURY|nr:peptidase C11 clostripain [uncultured marine group II/III euryarchaeote AD1000_41_D11]